MLCYTSDTNFDWAIPARPKICCHVKLFPLSYMIKSFDLLRLLGYYKYWSLADLACNFACSPIPVGTRLEMNVFCTFKIGPFVRIKKGRLLDVLKIIFILHLNVFQLQFKFMRKIVICLLSEKHFNFMIWNFMTLFEGM